MHVCVKIHHRKKILANTTLLIIKHLIVHKFVIRHWEIQNQTTGDAQTTHHIYKHSGLLLLVIPGCQLNSISSSSSSSSSNLLEYKHSSGLAPPGAHSPQHEPHRQWTPFQSFPCHLLLECA